MSINKNTLWTVFAYACVLMSPVFFSKLPFIPNTMLANLTAVMYILGAIILTVINLKTNKSNTLSEKKDDYGLIVSLGLIAIVGSYFLQMIVVLIEVFVFKMPIESENTQNIAAIIRNSPFFMLAVMIGGPIMEEFVFRFSVINFLNQKLNIWVSAIISSFLFAAIHNDGHYLRYGSLGFLFFLVYKKTGSLLTAIIAHAGMNSFVVILQLVFIK
ncbi:CPBP family intramembrane glutamic endopeptidase [Vagococcus fluvialis]|uniref:CPBP family intramembrane glutamic endopeptidase n=1 Tax=Vagococcus fluvialis TaxID=2738 RepID=UPI001A8ED589|nr:type II CAAX endopeptidase family protein [Vagococcus fluvialis]MBO0442517.1 CPBP family intramembrane metalloprotease [Vagococcus fluvialis]MCM2138216.1 CPBP family intramembrane metalloprotease [Vagococcus fluvialis]